MRSPRLSRVWGRREEGGPRVKPGVTLGAGPHFIR